MSEFRRRIAMSQPVSEYAYELNNYVLDGNNWIDTGLFPFNTGKNFEIELTIDGKIYSHQQYNEYILSLYNINPNTGFRILYDGVWNHRYYCSYSYSNRINDCGFVNTNKVISYTYKYINGVSYLYLDNTLLLTDTRTITSSKSLKIGIGNYDEDSAFLNSLRIWHGTILHFHLKYLDDETSFKNSLGLQVTVE